VAQLDQGERNLTSAIKASGELARGRAQGRAGSAREAEGCPGHPDEPDAQLTGDGRAARAAGKYLIGVLNADGVGQFLYDWHNSVAMFGAVDNSMVAGARFGTHFHPRKAKISLT